MTDCTSKNDSQLALVVSDGETSTAVKLLAAGADPNTRTEDGELVLAVACQEGDLAMVSALLDAGAEVDALDSLGEPPLATAASKGHVDVVARLMLEVRAVDSGRLLTRAALPGWPEFIYSLPANRFVVELHGGAICVVEAAAVEG